MLHEIPEYMSADYVKDKTSVDILWRQLATLQEIASDFGISNIFQDNGAEILQQLIYLNMKAVPGREGDRPAVLLGRGQFRLSGRRHRGLSDRDGL